MEKDWLKRPSDRQLQEAQKKTDRVIHNAWGGGSPCPCTLGTARVPICQADVPPSRSTLTGAEVPQAKKKSCIYAPRVTCVMSNSMGPCRVWPARLLCQVGSPGKNTRLYWPILVAIPF